MRVLYNIARILFLVIFCGGGIAGALREYRKGGEPIFITLYSAIAVEGIVIVLLSWLYAEKIQNQSTPVISVDTI